MELRHTCFASLDPATFEVCLRGRPSDRLELKFALGNAVSLFPKEKYPAARSEAAGEGGREGQSRAGEGIRSSFSYFGCRVWPSPSLVRQLQVVAVPGAFGQLKLSLD